jgi:hypothetical protein
LSGAGVFKVEGGTIINNGNGGAININSTAVGANVIIGNESLVASNVGGNGIHVEANSVIVQIEEGGTVESLPEDTAAAIQVISSLEGVRIEVNGGSVLADISGYAINDGSGTATTSNNTQIVSNGGEIIAGSNSAIHSTGTGSKVTVNGGIISDAATTNINPVIYMNGGTGDNVLINGGIVQAKHLNSFVIQTTGNVEVSGGQVSSINGRAINIVGPDSKATISGGVVQATGSGVAISTATTAGIDIHNTSIIIDGGTVLSTSGIAINTTGSNSSVSIISGKVSSTTANTINASGVNTKISITGGSVTATAGYAIYTQTTASAANISVTGGFVFAYGSAVIGAGNVIRMMGAGLVPTITSPAVVAAWNISADSTKTHLPGATDFISLLPTSGATAVWRHVGDENGIEYHNGINSGFHPLDVIIAADTDFGLIFDASDDPDTGGRFWLDINGNETIDAGDLEYIPPVGTAVWNAGSKTLVLNDFVWITPSHYALYIIGDSLTIDLAEGSTSKLVSTYDGPSASSGIIIDTSVILTVESLYSAPTSIGNLIAKAGNSTTGISSGIWAASPNAGLTIKSGKLTASGGYSESGSYGVNVYKINLIGNSDDLLLAIGGQGSASVGVLCRDLEISGGTLHAVGDPEDTASQGIVCSNSLVFRAGTLEVSGLSTAFNLATPDSLKIQASGYTWWSNAVDATNPGGAGTLCGTGIISQSIPDYGSAYTSSASDKYIKLTDTAFALVKDVTVTGRQDALLPSGQSATVYLYGTRLLATVDLDDFDASSWFIDLPDGIAVFASASGAVATNRLIEFSFDGTPTDIGEDVLALSIPGLLLNSGLDLLVFDNPDALFKITEALVFTYDPDFDIPSMEVDDTLDPIDVSDGVSGGLQPYTYSASGLPTGLVIDSETGIISGSPTTETAAGTAVITVTDEDGSTASITINFGEITPASGDPDDPDPDAPDPDDPDPDDPDPDDPDPDGPDPDGSSDGTSGGSSGGGSGGKPNGTSTSNTGDNSSLAWMLVIGLLSIGSLAINRRRIIRLRS